MKVEWDLSSTEVLECFKVWMEFFGECMKELWRLENEWTCLKFEDLLHSFQWENNYEIMKVMNEKSNSTHVLIELNVLMFEWSFYVEKCGRRYTVKKVAELKNRRTYSVNAESA